MEVVSWPFWDLGRDWLLEGYLLAVALELRDMFIETAFQREAMLCAAQKTVFKHSHHRLECSAVARHCLQSAHYGKQLANHEFAEPLVGFLALII